MPPSVRELLRAWFAIGTQSIGGGSSTQLLMRRLLVERSGWISRRDFLEDWALSRLSPGIHLIALAGMLGRRLRGPRGAAIAVVTMMLPAGLITAGMTAGADALKDQPLVAAALAGMAPVTLGLTAGFSVTMARGTMRTDRRAILDVALFVAAIGAGSFVPSLTVAIILSGALIGGLLLRGERQQKAETPLE